MDYLTGIDLGSKSLKCAIHELDGNIVSISNRQPEGYNPYPDHPEWMVWNTEIIGVGLCQNEQDASERVYKMGMTYDPDPHVAPGYVELCQIYS